MTALIRHASRLYRVRRVNADGSITCWGPLTADGRNGPRSRIRTFRADTVSVVADAQAVSA